MFERKEKCSVCGLTAPWSEFYCRIVKDGQAKAYCSKKCMG